MFQLICVLSQEPEAVYQRLGMPCDGLLSMQEFTRVMTMGIDRRRNHSWSIEDSDDDDDDDVDDDYILQGMATHGSFMDTNVLDSQ